MSTRGTIAVKIGGVTKGSYNHSDSYPDWLGNRVLEYIAAIKVAGMDEARRQARLLKKVPSRKPTALEIEKLAPYTDLGVSEGTTQDWYCLLRLTQGNLKLILEAGYYYPCGVGEEEWSYVVDFDTDTLAVYEGNVMIAIIPFDRLPDRFMDDRLSNIGDLRVT
jgi:hypothetical protein